MSVSPILAVDPGISGAVAFLYPVINRVSVYDTPVAGGEVDIPNLTTLIKNYAPGVAIIERVSALPGNGSVSMFNFGRCYGDVRGVIGALNIPVHFVTPQKWKKHFNLSKDKEQSRMLAIRLFPSVADRFALKKHSDRAEAVLLALYGDQEILKRSVA